MPLLSVIIPSYQQGRFIERTLQSILNQEIDGIEIIIQDGGSTDETLSIIQRYAAQYPHLIQYVSQKDKGQTDAINQGLRKAHGEILCYLNSDDTFYPGALKKVLQTFQQSPEALILYGKANHIDEEDLIIEPYPVEPWNYKKLIETCYISQPACFWRREVMNKFGLFDETLHYTMDYEYWLRVGKQIPFLFIDATLAGSRCHPDAKTWSQKPKAYAEMVQMYQRFLDGHAPARRVRALCIQRGLRHLPASDKANATWWQWLLFTLEYFKNYFAMLPLVSLEQRSDYIKKFFPPYKYLKQTA